MFAAMDWGVVAELVDILAWPAVALVVLVGLRPLRKPLIEAIRWGLRARIGLPGGVTAEIESKPFGEQPEDGGEPWADQDDIGVVIVEPPGPEQQLRWWLRRWPQRRFPH